MACPVCSNERHLIFVFWTNWEVGVGTKRENQAIPIVTVKVLRSCIWLWVCCPGGPTSTLSLNKLEIQPVHSKGDQPWVFFGRNDAKAETPVLWPPHVKSWLIGKDSDTGRDWGQEEKGTTEIEMAGWHHRLDGREFEWTWGDGDGQGGLACCDSWGHIELDTTERLNWTDWG